MAVRRFNYTNRKRIRRKDIHLIIHENDGSVSFDLEKLRLVSYDLPSNADIWIEAYREEKWLRSSAGKVEEPLLLTNVDISVFGVADGVKFRLKIISSDARAGLILAGADSIQPTRPDVEEDNQKPLLPVIPDSDLDELVFKVNFDVPGPNLHVNNKIPNWPMFVKSDIFISLALPTILREIMSRILLPAGSFSDDDDLRGWEHDWIELARSLPGVHEFPEGAADEPDNEDQLEMWIDEVVRAFCRNFRTLKSALQFCHLR